MTDIWRVACAIAIVLRLGSTVAAQAPALHESVVVSASSEPLPFESVARSVWVLTRSEIERLPVRSISDLLRFASSVDVRARGPYVQADISLRGGSFGQTLVLVDGVRLNDSQSGHHNTDIPLTLDDVERVEVLFGAGSSLFGADAFGGTINIVTRDDARPFQSTLVAGDHGLVGGRARAGFERRNVGMSFSVEAVRSSGFETARDFETVVASGRASVGRATQVLVGHAYRDFGANGFYGPAPSHETTDQTVVGVTHAFGVRSWRTTVQAMHRIHGDRFVYDPRVPAPAINRHRTQATTAVIRASRSAGPRTRVSIGTEAGGDWIRSNNLGHHSFARGSGFVEVQQLVSGGLLLYPGLRYDYYSGFGHAWSPSIGLRWPISKSLSARASGAQAFRVPTFTELYYRDPNHQASADLTPERGWSADAGVDWRIGPALLARATAFVRRDRDVIDWTRPSAAERWQTMNVRHVAGAGIEVGVRHVIGDASWFDMHYTHLRTRASALEGLLSKYVLEYAPHNLVVSGAIRGPWRLDIGPRLAWTDRNDRRGYVIADLRISRAVGEFLPFIEASNLFDERYQEIVGVDMPGRWISAGVRVGLPRSSRPSTRREDRLEGAGAR